MCSTPWKADLIRRVGCTGTLRSIWDKLNSRGQVNSRKHKHSNGDTISTESSPKNCKVAESSIDGAEASLNQLAILDDEASKLFPHSTQAIMHKYRDQSQQINHPLEAALNNAIINEPPVEAGPSGVMNMFEQHGEQSVGLSPNVSLDSVLELEQDDRHSAGSSTNESVDGVLESMYQEFNFNLEHRNERVDQILNTIDQGQVQGTLTK